MLEKRATQDGWIGRHQDKELCVCVRGCMCVHERSCACDAREKMTESVVQQKLPFASRSSLSSSLFTLKHFVSRVFAPIPCLRSGVASSALSLIFFVFPTSLSLSLAPTRIQRERLAFHATNDASLDFPFSPFALFSLSPNRILFLQK